MARDVVDAQPIESKRDLVAWLEEGVKPADAVRVGTEHEKFPFYVADLSPVPYEGERGIARHSRRRCRLRSAGRRSRTTAR